MAIDREKSGTFDGGTSPAATPSSAGKSGRPFPGDLLLLFLLVFANLPGERDLEFGRMMADLGAAGAPGAAFFARSLVDNPIGSAQAALAVALLIVYGLAATGVIAQGARSSIRVRVLLLAALVSIFVILPLTGEVYLRFAAGPKGHAHDGGVIQTEEALKFFLRGVDPYGADYRSTPMASLEWGPGNPAIIHHPYFPLSFLAHAPFFAAGKALFGGYDARFLYLLVYLAPFPLVWRWSRKGETKLMLVALWGLNPFLAPFVVQGRNDVVVLAVLVGTLHLLMARRTVTAALLFGAACATKQFALLFTPFLLLLLGGGAPSMAGALGRGARRLWPAALAAGLFIIPFVLWNPASFFDDTVAFNTGSSPVVSYPLGGTPGYGGANWVNIFGLVESRYNYFPFWIFQVLIVAPALFLLLRRQRNENTAARAAAAFSLFLMIFLYCSRIFHLNYLGAVFFLLAAASLSGRLRGFPERGGVPSPQEGVFTPSDSVITDRRASSG